MQGALHMWTEHKSRHNLKDIRQKRMQRHVFLYEKAVLFCKRRGDIRDKTFYAYKNSIAVSTMSLICFRINYWNLWKSLSAARDAKMFTSLTKSRASLKFCVSVREAVTVTNICNGKY